MARYNIFSTGMRIVFFLLLFVTLVVFGMFWFDQLGILDSKTLFGPVLDMMGIKKRTALVNAEDPMLLDKERLKVQTDALALQEEELGQRAAKITEDEAKIKQVTEELAAKQEELEKKEKSLNERINLFDKKRENLAQNARYLVGMKPKNAVDILNAMENDMDVIDLFRMTEELAKAEGEASIVAYWLSLMPPERSARLTRLMSKQTLQQ